MPCWPNKSEQITDGFFCLPAHKRGPAFICRDPPKATPLCCGQFEMEGGPLLCFLVWSCNPVPVVLLPPASSASGTCYLGSCSAAMPPVQSSNCSSNIAQFKLFLKSRFSSDCSSKLTQFRLYLKSRPVQTGPQILPSSNCSPNRAQRSSELICSRLPATPAWRSDLT